MAEKGVRAQLEPVARQMHVDGKSLSAISEALDVSRNTLTEWKARTKRPGDDLDEWDKARAAKEGYEAHLLEVRDEIMKEIKAKPLQANAYLDSLSKIEAILDRRARSAREATDAIERQRGEMFLQFIKDLIEYGGKHDQGLTEVIQDNFDDLIQWGREKYAA